MEIHNISSDGNLKVPIGPVELRNISTLELHLCVGESPKLTKKLILKLSYYYYYRYCVSPAAKGCSRVQTSLVTPPSRSAPLH